MYCLVNIDFYGSDEELKKLDESYKAAADNVKGVKYVGRFSPNQIKWHWTYFFKTESLVKMDECWQSWKYERDRNKWTHGIVEYYYGPM